MSKCYIEKLYHFHCQNCGAWWTQADAKIELNQKVYCPRCMTSQTIEEFEVGEDKITAFPQPVESPQ